MIYTEDKTFISEEFEKGILQDFLNTIKNKNTKVEYKRYIRMLCNKFACKDYLDINEEDAYDAINMMKEQVRLGKLSNGTVATRLSCYNRLSDFIMENYPTIHYDNPFKGIERPTIDNPIDRYKMPSMEEVDNILTSAKNEPMYYLIIAISVRTGMSPSKILRIRRNDLFEENGVIGVCIKDENNHRKDITIAFPDDISKLIRSYLNGITSQDKYLWINKHGHPLTLKNLDTNISRIVKNANISKDYKLKDLRARAIIEMIDAGATEQDVQKYIGLGSLRMRQYSEAIGLARQCPANLVNFQLRV